MSKENLKDEDLQKITGAGDDMASSGGPSKDSGNQPGLDPSAPAEGGDWSES